MAKKPTTKKKAAAKAPAKKEAAEEMSPVAKHLQRTPMGAIPSTDIDPKWLDETIGGKKYKVQRRQNGELFRKIPAGDFREEVKADKAPPASKTENKSEETTGNAGEHPEPDPHPVAPAPEEK